MTGWRMQWVKSRFPLVSQSTPTAMKRCGKSFKELLVDLCNQGPPRPHQHYADSGGHCSKLQVPGGTRGLKRKTLEEARLLMFYHLVVSSGIFCSAGQQTGETHQEISTLEEVSAEDAERTQQSEWVTPLQTSTFSQRQATHNVTALPSILPL